MRISVVSDLHVENWQEFPFNWDDAPEADALVVAGDTADSIELTRLELLEASKRYPLVLWIDGNHEAFHFGPNLPAAAAAAAALDLPPNCRCIGNRTTVLHEHTLFVGANAWWDFEFSAPQADNAQTRQRFREMALAPADPWFAGLPADGRPIDDVIDGMAAADFEWVRGNVERAQSDAAVRAIVIVTHTVPHRLLLCKGVYPKAAEDAGFYGNSRMEAMQEHDPKRKIRYWLFGHSHSGADEQLGHVRFISNPRGRPEDFNRTEYAARVVTVRVEEETLAEEAPL